VHIEANNHVMLNLFQHPSINLDQWSARHNGP